MASRRAIAHAGRFAACRASGNLQCAARSVARGGGLACGAGHGGVISGGRSMTTKTDAGIKKRGALLSVLTLAACCALIACDAGKTAPKTFDHAADKLPFVRPA